MRYPVLKPAVKGDLIGDDFRFFKMTPIAMPHYEKRPASGGRIARLMVEGIEASFKRHFIKGYLLK